jgi:phenylpropionate dioxygenase-like ring-hydroxylating dioxygenase large terminal subunit
MEATTSLSSYWHPIARADQIHDQPQRFTLLDEQLVAFRDADGVAVFKDLCIHRGAALSLGWIDNARLTCAYHGWQYDRSGACVRIPSRPEGTPIPGKAHAITYRATERYGLVWVAMEDPVAPIPPFPDDEFDDPSYRAFLSYDVVWKTSAARAVENFMDFSHFPYVHENLLGSRDHTVVEPYDVLEKDYGMFYAFEQEEPSELYGAKGMNRIRYEYYLYLPFTIHLRKIEPNGNTTVISLASGPISAKESRNFVWIVRNHSIDRPDPEFGDFTNTIMEQDRVVVESQRPEEIPLDLREELHIKVPDAASILYRRQLADLDVGAPFMP